MMLNMDFANFFGLALVQILRIFTFSFSISFSILYVVFVTDARSLFYRRYKVKVFQNKVFFFLETKTSLSLISQKNVENACGTRIAN